MTGNKPGSTAHYYCNKGLKVVGDVVRKCLYNGYWSGEEPECKPILCPNLKGIPYGSVKMTGNKPGSTAHYYCNKGSKLVGDAWRKCLYNGYWSGEEPECKKIVCPHPKPILYGSVRADTYHPTSKAYYSCDYGYELHGPGYRTCLDSGAWDGKPPVCHKKIVCPHLDHPQYGRVSVKGYTPLSRAYYSCDNGYERYGLKYRKCLSDGSWYGKPPVCRKRIACPPLPHPQYGYVRVDGYIPLSKAYYSCNDGYVRYGLAYRKCLSDGSWYGKAPKCRPKHHY